MKFRFYNLFTYFARDIQKEVYMLQSVPECNDLSGWVNRDIQKEVYSLRRYTIYDWDIQKEV
jgi:hypothetical protein